ncbi:DUF6069 family protein [Microbacterium sp. H83]|uniref:DUF6069 family protein n=1 Tax=Microbacterium sp. H83 TaxID=1827324 RepID=UPI0007F33F75|nr:DUF6069 family protein [Microbacterium sp. H83]OAN35733.1 hypothetical protein A4X16_17220 [Microbacterium sp. H83]
MVSPASPRRAVAPSRMRIVIILAVAAAAAIVVNAGIAALALAAGAPAGYGPLTPPAFALFTVLGVVAGWIGWTQVQRRARDPRRTLRVLVPVLTLLSLVPDVLLMTLRFIPGTTTGAAVALMAMHLVVVAVAVPAYVLASRPSAARGRVGLTGQPDSRIAG